MILAHFSRAKGDRSHFCFCSSFSYCVLEEDLNSVGKRDFYAWHDLVFVPFTG